MGIKTTTNEIVFIYISSLHRSFIHSFNKNENRKRNKLNNFNSDFCIGIGLYIKLYKEEDDDNWVTAFFSFSNKYFFLNFIGDRSET